MAASNGKATLRWESPDLRWTYGSPEGWAEVVTALVNQPFEWAIVFESSEKWGATDLQQSIRQGRVPLPAGLWQFHAQGCSAGATTSRLFARYLGASDSEDAVLVSGRPDIAAKKVATFGDEIPRPRLMAVNGR